MRIYTHTSSYDTDDNPTVSFYHDSNGQIACATCGTDDLHAGLFDRNGEAVCMTCAKPSDQIIPTDWQRTINQGWTAAGIGTN